MNDMLDAIETVATPAVELWIAWIMIIFLLSVVFVWQRNSARYALGAIALTLPFTTAIFNLTGEIYLIGIAHLLLWGPLAFYLVKNDILDNQTNLKSIYGVWLFLLLSTIAVSLLFDVRDIILVVQGVR